MRVSASFVTACFVILASCDINAAHPAADASDTQASTIHAQSATPEPSRALDHKTSETKAGGRPLASSQDAVPQKPTSKTSSTSLNRRQSKTDPIAKDVGEFRITVFALQTKAQHMTALLAGKQAPTADEVTAACKKVEADNPTFNDEQLKEPMKAAIVALYNQKLGPPDKFPSLPAGGKTSVKRRSSKTNPADKDIGEFRITVFALQTKAQHMSAIMAGKTPPTADEVTAVCKEVEAEHPEATDEELKEPIKAAIVALYNEKLGPQDP